ncbi:hypothetical protein DPMN_136232 [Dreissena polymorpha]|uniref:Uncharacterized protein n=1 Tax=Dreissena polymorpha TaxID=45954 RepID=A0A9D4G2C9_DREPO|nr:hypothetical protein DPMN_136232 [Dreissena polymorpha]
MMSVASQSDPTRSKFDNINLIGGVTAIHASRLHLHFVYINNVADDADVNKYYVDNDVYDGYGKNETNAKTMTNMTITYVV